MRDQHHKIHLTLILAYLPGMTPVCSGPYADARILLHSQALPLINALRLADCRAPSMSAALLASRRYQAITRSEFGDLQQFLTMYAYYHAAVTVLAKRCRMRSSISYAVTTASTRRMIIGMRMSLRISSSMMKSVEREGTKRVRMSPLG